MPEKLEMLSKDQITRIHEASLRVLERTGVKFWHPEAVRILAAAGADANPSTGIVRFPPDLVMDSIKKAPNSVVLGGRDRRHDLVLEKGRTHFGTLGTAPLVIDLDTRERRYALKRDLECFARIADALESTRYFHTSVTPSDVKPGVVDLHRWATALRNTSKHLMGASVYNTDNCQYVVRMCEAAVGSPDKMRSRPPMTATECPVSPLQHDRRPLHGMMEFARNGLPVIVYSEPKAGATSPASLAGTLVVTNSEVLSGVTLIQQVNPGAPVIYGSVATLMDMRTGGIAFGSPETALLAASTTQLAGHYGIPNMTPGGRTDSKTPCDAQTGYEKMRSALIVALAGGNLGNMAGLIESNLTASYDQLIVDDEIIGSIERITDGLDTEPEGVAEEVISSVGPGGTFLANRHTMTRFRKEHYMPRVSDRTFYAGWLRGGSRELRDVAREKAKQILSSHQPLPIDRDLDRELDGILREAESRS